MASYNNFNNGQAENDKVGFDIIEHIGVIDVEKSGWIKEVNIVSWNNREPKLDIRTWNPDHERMAKGLTFTEKEAFKLARLLENRFPERLHNPHHDPHRRRDRYSDHAGESQPEDDDQMTAADTQGHEDDSDYEAFDAEAV